MTTDDRILARSDCEHCRPGLISQPANTISSLAYVIAGADMMRRARRGSDRTERSLDLARGAATIGVGLGSVAYHGPGGRLGKWTHDASLVSMLLLGDLRVARHLRPDTAVPDLALVAVPAVATFVTQPRLSDASQATAAVATVTAQVARAIRVQRGGNVRPRHLATVGLFAVAAAAHGLGRTGMPLCRPQSLLQPHAAWHVLSAAAIWRESIDLAEAPAPRSTAPRSTVRG
jgi:uncharacterized membrane protein YfcA